MVRKGTRKESVNNSNAELQLFWSSFHFATQSRRSWSRS